MCTYRFESTHMCVLPGGCVKSLHDRCGFLRRDAANTHQLFAEHFLDREILQMRTCTYKNKTTPQRAATMVTTITHQLSNINQLQQCAQWCDLSSLMGLNRNICGLLEFWARTFETLQTSTVWLDRRPERRRRWVSPAASSGTTSASWSASARRWVVLAKWN